MDAKPSKRPIPTGTAIFFVEKDGPSESFTKFLKFRRLTDSESELIKREVLPQSEKQSKIYAAAFKSAGHGAARVRPGNRAISRAVDACSIFEDIRLNRTVGDSNIVILEENNTATSWHYSLDKGSSIMKYGPKPREELSFECYSEEIAACLNIRISKETKPIHKTLGLALHFFRRGTQAEENILKFIFLVCAVDNIGGKGKGKCKTGEIAGHLKSLYPLDKQAEIEARVRKVFSKRGDLFHANRILDDVTLENEEYIYHGELSFLRRLFLDALHALLPLTKTHETLNQAWNALGTANPCYDPEVNDGVMTTMGNMQRLNRPYSVETLTLFRSIAASAFNDITPPSPDGSP